MTPSSSPGGGGGYTDEQVIAAIGAMNGGGRSFRIAVSLTGQSNGDSPGFIRALTRRLLRMEREGKVRRSKRYSVPNSYFWELVGLTHPKEQTDEQ